MAGGNVPGKIKPYIIGAAKQYGIRPSDLAGLLDVESNLGANRSTSSAGAVGIAQFLPSTARSIGVNPYNDRSAIYGAAKYLSQLGYRSNRLRALGAYNGGPGNPQYGYARQVISEGNRLGRQLQGAQAPAQGAQGPSGTTTITKTLTPGVDNSGLRQQLMYQYLSKPQANPFSAQNLSPGKLPSPDKPVQGNTGLDPVNYLAKAASGTQSLFNLAGNLSQAQDVAPTTKTVVQRQPGQVRSAGGGGGGGGIVFRGVTFTPGVVGIGKALQKLGLHVGENPHFGGVTGGDHHSYGYYDHYHGGAIDVTGPSWLLNTVANFLAHHKAQLGIPTSGVPNLGGKRGTGVLYQVPGHYDHLHVSARH